MHVKRLHGYKHTQVCLQKHQLLWTKPKQVMWNVQYTKLLERDLHPSRVVLRHTCVACTVNMVFIISIF